MIKETEKEIHKEHDSLLEESIEYYKNELVNVYSINEELEEYIEELSQENRELKLDAKEYIETIHLMERQLYGTKEDNLNKDKSTPDHYNAKVDVIDFFKMHFGENDMKKVHLFNIIKYATRFGKKDEELKEVNKIIHYAEMLKEIVEHEWDKETGITKER